jgi:hypothetical protein
MKFVEPSNFADPDVAARKLVEIANGIEAVQDGRIYIELVNSAFLDAGGTPDPGHWGVGLRVFNNPLGCVMLGNETLDYFRFAIGP